MNKHSYHSLKGDFFVRPRVDGGKLRYIGNVPEASFAMTRETIKLTSSGNESGTLAEDEVSKDATLSLTLNSFAAKNLSMVLFGSVVQQAAATNVAFTLPALEAGEAFKLDHENVSNVAITGLTAGTDYKLLDQGGVIVALTDISASASGTYDAATASKVGVFTQSAQEYEVVYVSQASGKTVVFRRWQPSPAQTLALVSNEFATFQVEGSCLIDETIAEGPLGRFAVITDTKA